MKTTMHMVLALSLVGCVGVVSEPGADLFRPEGHPGSEPGTLHKRWLEDNAGPNPLRRLTMEQLRYAILDLTGVDVDRASLPPEAHRDGFVGFASLQVSSESQVRAFMTVAEDVAQAVDLDALVSCPAYDALCAEALLDGFGRLVFRGQLSPEEWQRYRDLYDAALPLGDEEALRYVVRGLLSAPRFLYRSYAFNDEPGQTGYAVAEKLAFFLWQSAPDDALLTAAEMGELDTPAGRSAWASAMLDDPRAERTVDAFHRQWLRLDDLEGLSPDPALYPEFSPELPAAYQEETLRVARDAFFAPDGTLTRLLTSRTTHVDDALADLYGYTAPGSGFAPTETGEPRAGVLMLGGTMSRLSTLRRAEPVYRGAFILNQVLCRELELPGDLNVQLPEPDPTQSYREQVEDMTSGEFCNSCHRYINPLGFALDAFDALGRYRPMQDGFAIDTSVVIDGLGDVDGEYADGPAMLDAVARSRMAGECYAEKWYELAMGRARDPDLDQSDFDGIYASFDAQDRSLRGLVLAIVESPSF